MHIAPESSLIKWRATSEHLKSGRQLEPSSSFLQTSSFVRTASGSGAFQIFLLLFLTFKIIFYFPQVIFLFTWPQRKRTRAKLLNLRKHGMQRCHPHHPVPPRTSHGLQHTVWEWLFRQKVAWIIKFLFCAQTLGMCCPGLCFQWRWG